MNSIIDAVEHIYIVTTVLIHVSLPWQIDTRGVTDNPEIWWTKIRHFTQSVLSKLNFVTHKEPVYVQIATLNKQPTLEYSRQLILSIEVHLKK